MPELASPPLSTTLTYDVVIEGVPVTKNFAINQYCKVRDLVNGKEKANYWRYYRLCDITEVSGVSTAYWCEEESILDDYYNKDEIDEKFDELQAPTVVNGRLIFPATATVSVENGRLILTK